MKKLLCIAVLTINLLNATYSQNIQLTFTAQSGGTHIPLDSIKIENLSQMCDTMLYGNDTTLFLSSTTVSAESVIIEDNTTEIQNYPNPFMEQTQIKIKSSVSQFVHLKVYNLKGQEVAIFGDFLSAGTHEFTFNAGNDKVYIVSFESSNKREFIKIVTLGSQKSATSELTYNGICMDFMVSKSVKANFVWAMGNELRFTGYVTLLPNIAGNHIINAIPTQNESYTFLYTPINVPGVTTAAISNITATTASGGGNVTSDGGASVTSRGICWSTSPNPTIAGNYTTNGIGTGSFISSLTNLGVATTYYVRAYATNAAGTAYGNEVQFTTLAQLPIVSTAAISNITATTASGGGNVTSDGGASVTSRGICWSTSPNPTIASNYTTNGIGTGSFNSSLTNLGVATTYYVRAYATNAAGTAYGNEVQFTTLAQLPIVTTAAISNITATSASGGGNVTSDGGASVTSRGICWSTSPNPTITGNYTTNGTGTGSFNSSLTNLGVATTYYVRAYATNATGTSYGNEVQFTTLAQLPIVTTTAISNITATSASGGGNVTSDGGASVTSRGICWSTSQNPTLANNVTINGNGTGSFISSLASLQEVTTYYVRAYATNAVGTAYGNQVQFTTTTTCVAFTDARDGNVYQAVKIGNQCWMSENLKYLPYVYEPSSGSSSARRYYVYGLNNSTDTAVAKAHPNYSTYGVLYNWRAAMNSQSSSSTNPSQRQGVCPTGWHMPSDDEWKQLEMELGMTQAQADGINWRGTNQGSKLAGSSSLWSSGVLKTNASFNSSGFNGKPGGYRSTNNYFISLNEFGFWWTATENDADNAWRRSLVYNQTDVNRYYSSKEIGMSVRCVKD